MTAIVQCAECRMFSHKASSHCGFCGKNLLGDKTRQYLSQAIPPLALVTVLLFVVDFAVTLPSNMHHFVLLFDDFLLILFITDLAMDHGLHRFRMKTFFKKRARDILFVASALGFVRFLRMTKYGFELERYATEFGKIAHSAEKGFLSAEKASIVTKFGHDVAYAMPAVDKFKRFV